MPLDPSRRTALVFASSWLLVGSLVTAIGCQAPKAPDDPDLQVTIQQGYPLFDGRCDEYADLSAQSTELPHDVTLWTFQDAAYVWLCLALPEESMGTIDLRIEAPGLEDAVNLHVSAQLGEWRADFPDEAPQDAASPIWGTTHGWFANAATTAYRQDEEGELQRTWAYSEGREVQLDKDRFGRGSWKLHLQLEMIRDDEGQFQTVFHPPTSAPSEEGQSEEGLSESAGPAPTWRLEVD